MSKYRLFVNGEPEDDVFDTEQEAEEYSWYLRGCAEYGAEIFHDSNPGDYEYDPDTYEDYSTYEIVEEDDDDEDADRDAAASPAEGAAQFLEAHGKEAAIIAGVIALVGAAIGGARYAYRKYHENHPEKSRFRRLKGYIEI